MPVSSTELVVTLVSEDMSDTPETIVLLSYLHDINPMRAPIEHKTTKTSIIKVTFTFLESCSFIAFDAQALIKNASN